MEKKAALKRIGRANLLPQKKVIKNPQSTKWSIEFTRRPNHQFGSALSTEACGCS